MEGVEIRSTGMRSWRQQIERREFLKGVLHSSCVKKVHCIAAGWSLLERRCKLDIFVHQLQKGIKSKKQVVKWCSV